MAHRNGTYVAFDALGETDPTKSDFRFYSLIKSWAGNKDIEFHYVNSHDKTYAVKDTSKRATLEEKIRKRLSNSKNVFVILSSQTRKSGSMLSYEIEQAVDNYELPLIIAYADYRIIADPCLLSQYWPKTLTKRIKGNTAKAIHIPFIQPAIVDAIGRFSIHNEEQTLGPYSYYSAQAHREFGELFGPFVNTIK